MKRVALCLNGLLTSRATGDLRVAMFGGRGAYLGERDFPYRAVLEQAVAGLGGSLSVLLEDDIRGNLTTDAFDAVFFPGGYGSTQAEALGLAGMAAVRAFVAGGGGYIGTCGGAFLALKGLLLYGPGPDGRGPPAQELGAGTVKMEFTEQAIRDLALDRKALSGNVTIFYTDGPVVAAEALPPGVDVLAWYRTKLPYPRPLGRCGLLNMPAITSAEYGAGRVVLNAPHPEHSQSAAGLGVEVYRGELAWVLQNRHALRMHLPP